MNPTFSNQPIPPEPSEEKATPVTTTPSPSSEATGAETTGAEPPVTEAPVPESVATEPAPPSFSPSLTDDTILHRFREGGNSGAVLAALERDFGLELSTAVYTWTRTVFSSLRRDPTAGELRLLAALTHEGKGTADRLAVNRLYTDSDEIAHAWATMMDHHAALYALDPRATPRADGLEDCAPPCTLAEALSLSGDYRRALHTASPRAQRTAITRICIPSAELPAALAEGYSPQARFLTEAGERVVCHRVGPGLTETGERAGDLLLLTRRVPHAAVEKLISAERSAKAPRLAAIRALVGTSLLDGVLSLCRAADIYVARAIPPSRDPVLRGRLDTEVLTVPRFPSDPHTADYLMRVSVKQARALSEGLRKLGISAVVLGQVRANDRTVIHVPDRNSSRDMPCADLPTAILSAARSVERHSYTPIHKPSPEGYTLTRSLLSRLPSPLSSEGGLTAEGTETVALTAAEQPLLSLPEAGAVVHRVTARILDSDSTYEAAGQTVEAALRPLSEAGVPKDSLFLSLSVTAVCVKDRATDGLIALLCGIHQRLDELGISAEDTRLELIPTPDGETLSDPFAPSVTLSVTAMGTLPQAPEADPTQWRGENSAEGGIHVLLPILRPACEGVTRGVAAALRGRVASHCTLCPVAVVKAEDAAIHPDSLGTLTARLATADLTVLAMEESDARLLLSNGDFLAALRERLEAGGRLLLLGRACIPAAEAGLLPAELSAPFDAVSPSLRPLTVTYARPEVPSVRRMPRAPLLSPAVPPELPHLVTLHSPDGDIPDGFVGCEGRALGLVNGLDTAAASLLSEGDLSPRDDVSVEL